jgi:hypothetical protein
MSKLTKIEFTEMASREKYSNGVAERKCSVSVDKKGLTIVEPTLETVPTGRTNYPQIVDSEETHFVPNSGVIPKRLCHWLLSNEFGLLKKLRNKGFKIPSDFAVKYVRVLKADKHPYTEGKVFTAYPPYNTFQYRTSGNNSGIISTCRIDEITCDVFDVFA